MKDTQKQSDKLIAFRKQEKFSAKRWNERGLKPSGDEICNRLEAALNQCADGLLELVREDRPPADLKKFLKKSLSAIDSGNYHAGEREFISDLFQDLSAVVQIEIKEDIMEWMYGNDVLALIRKVNKKK